MSAGYLSIMALKTPRAWSYRASSGSMTSPRRDAVSPVIASSAIARVVGIVSVIMNSSFVVANRCSRNNAVEKCGGIATAEQGTALLCYCQALGITVTDGVQESEALPRLLLAELLGILFLPFLTPSFRVGRR